VIFNPLSEALTVAAPFGPALVAAGAAVETEHTVKQITPLARQQKAFAFFMALSSERTVPDASNTFQTRTLGR
jgi:hypothetical protein